MKSCSGKTGIDEERQHQAMSPQLATGNQSKKFSKVHELCGKTGLTTYFVSMKMSLILRVITNASVLNDTYECQGTKEVLWEAGVLWYPCLFLLLYEKVGTGAVRPQKPEGSSL